jgi:hypothetical protein
VRDNLELKYKERIRSLEVEFRRKKKEVEMLVDAYVEKVRVIKI